MSMSVAAELALIAEAQEGSEEATLALLAEYRPNVEHIVWSNPGYDSDDLRQELTAGLLETVTSFDPSQGERLWPLFARGARLLALNVMARSLYPVDVPNSTAKLARKVMRRVDAGEALDDVIADEPDISRETYLSITGAFGSADISIHDEPEHDYDESRTVELAEVALDGMGHQRRALARIKYGFDVPIPTDSNSNGLPDIEVAGHFTEQVLGAGRAAAGELAISRATVQREVRSGLVQGEVAVRKYLASEGM